MSLTRSLRRTAVGLTATAMLLGGTLGFVSAAGTAGASGVAEPQATNTILLHNNTAETGTDCPKDGFAYWHFVLAPNNTYTFTLISLDLGTEVVTFSGAAIVPNGVQTDNVFVGVPAGHSLTDLVLSAKSYAEYTGGVSAPNNFNLSHVCVGSIPTTTTTQATTTTTAEGTTTTTTQATTTTTAEGTTTTTAEGTTTTTAEGTTTTTAEGTTTTTAEGTTTTTGGPGVLGTVQTPTTVAEVLGAVQVNGELPYTGTNTGGMVAAGLAVLLGGALLVGLARTKGRSLGEQ
jgi:LPXTG-motif cell wall-anchored protein